MGDHPRSRGVYKEALAYLDEQGGSSPLARGLRYTVAHIKTDSGIIPARAGFTLVNDVQDERRRDHPRSRGVYS